MDDELKKLLQDTVTDLKNAGEENPIANACMITFQNRMAGCLTEIVTQMKKINETLYSIDARLQAIDQNTEGD